MFTKKSISHPFPFRLSVAIMLVLLIGSSTALTSVRASGSGTIIIVDTIGDNATSDMVCSLREAIANANANAITYADCGAGSGDDLIKFDGALGKATITLSSLLPAITDTNGLAIDGGGKITISGNNLYRVFYINSGVPLMLNNLTVTAGIDGHNGGGGGAYNYGILTITNSTFSDNLTTLYYGGGAINNNGTLTVTNSTFSGNSSSNGGAIYNASGDIAKVTNSTFSGNTAGNTNSGISYDNGGGVYNAGTVTITNSTFSGNIAAKKGGGIYNAATGTMNQYNVIIANSTAGDCVNFGSLAGNNNLIESTGNNACGLANGVDGNIIGSDPNLGLPTGSPAYFPLKNSSPAIDAGDDAKCAAAPVNNKSQNGIPRPQGVHCDIGSYERQVTLTLKSAGAQDGWILESTETSNKGGTLDKTATTFNLGDNAQDKQYRAILHFNTATLPDTAVITKVTLKIKKQGQMGTNPFTILGGLKVDMRKPFFGANAGLVIGDFQATAGKSSVATFNPTPVSNWYSALLNAAGKAYVNKTGTTQFRLRFATDDNNDNAADYMKFYSGNYASLAARPTLVIEYYIP
jgi:CSLREA domain-containing protein